MFKQLSLRIKLSLAFLVVAMLVGVAGYFQVQLLNRANGLYSDIIQNDFARRDSLQSARQVLSDIERSGIEVSQQQSLVTPTAAREAIEGYQKQLDDLLQKYQANRSEDTQQAVSDQAIELLVQSAQKLVEASEAVVDAVAARSGLASATQSLSAARTQAHAQLDTVIELEEQNLRNEDDAVSASVTQALSIIVWVVVGVVVVAILLGVITASLLSRTLNRFRTDAKLIANGDFSRHLTIGSRDEVGLLGAAFNEMIDRLRLSYQRLAFETERSKALVKSIGEGIVAINTEMRITLINDQARQLLELPDDSMLEGTPAEKAMPLMSEGQKTVLPENAQPYARALQSAQQVHEVFDHKHRNGSIMKLDIVASPIIVNSETAGVIMTMRDVTKEKEVDRMKTEFISLASHQLRTPLSAIKWFAEMLSSGDAGELKPEQAEFTRNIADSTERMIALVNALLNISRIESGRIVVDPKPTDLRELVTGIVNDLKAKTETKQQTLIISVHADLPKISIDPRLIGQVYLNLLTNAIKYTPKGGEVSVFISRKDDMVISQVTDNGYGIPKEQQGRIFEKFFRAANAVKVETDGTGLGLYLIKAIVESSGGKVWFESEEGKGTTFWFSIPLSGMKPHEGEVTLDA